MFIGKNHKQRNRAQKANKRIMENIGSGAGKLPEICETLKEGVIMGPAVAEMTFFKCYFEPGN